MHKSTVIKRLIRLSLLLMIMGTLTELVLLSHYEDGAQTIPLICISALFVVLAIFSFVQSKLVEVLSKGLIILTGLSGVLGVYFHLNANFEFEQEMKPTAETWDLLMESLSGAFPALAPASLMVLALISYSYLFIVKEKS